jgi:glycerol-3-phosphate acyltransferase PlsY
MTEVGLSGVMVLVGAYLLGSVLFGVVILRSATGKDPRGSGSGNPGAANVMRIAGKRLGAAALALDAGKGAVAVLLARSLTPEESVLPVAAAVAAILGHAFPVFYRFRGGKGVATGLGAFLAISYRPVLASIVVFVVVLAAFRFVSLASLAAAASLAPFCLMSDESSAVSWAAAVTGALIVVRHHANIARLLDGVEPRLGSRGP